MQTKSKIKTYKNSKLFGDENIYVLNILDYFYFLSITQQHAGY